MYIKLLKEIIHEYNELTDSKIILIDTIKVSEGNYKHSYSLEIIDINKYPRAIYSKIFMVNEESDKVFEDIAKHFLKMFALNGLAEFIKNNGIYKRDDS